MRLAKDPMQGISAALTIVYLLLSFPSFAIADAHSVAQLQARIIYEADRALEQYEVSYAYGGAQLGAVKQCDECNRCLGARNPLPKQRLRECPSCNHCSLDCSHFTQLVFDNAGLKAPYIDTATMLALSPAQLRSRYYLIDKGSDAEAARPGDLLVYRGHVILLIAKRGAGRGDIIHATGGKDIREPGQGIQRERLVQLDPFRGPLLRVLRHQELEPVPPPKPAEPSQRRLRPVVKK